MGEINETVACVDCRASSDAIADRSRSLIDLIASKWSTWLIASTRRLCLSRCARKKLSAIEICPIATGVLNATKAQAKKSASPHVPSRINSLSNLRVKNEF